MVYPSFSRSAGNSGSFGRVPLRRRNILMVGTAKQDFETLFLRKCFVIGGPKLGVVEYCVSDDRC